MTTFSIDLDDDTAHDLTRIATIERRSPEELAIQLLIWSIAVEHFDLTRRQLRPYTEKYGYHSDDDIFRDFS